MKFFYNGQLVRTSKTHVYTHAVLHNGKLFSCASSRVLAERALASERSRANTGINNCRAAIQAAEAGKRRYVAKVGNRSFPGDVTRSADEYRKEIQSLTEWRDNGWEIVELEAKP